MYVHLCIFIHMSVHICAHIFPICAASAGERAQQAVSCVNASPASSWGAGGKLFPSDHQSGFWLIRAMILMIMIRIGWVLNVFGKSFWSRSSQFQRQEMVAPYSKRVLFVCERNLAESAMAEVRSCRFSACGKKTCIFLPLFVLWCSCILCCQAIFHHMGPNMARGWEGDSAGTKVVKRFSKHFFCSF